MTEQRFICGLGFPINSDDPIRIITDKETNKDYFKFSDICEIMNEQQATITHLEKVYGENFAKRRLLEQDNLILRNENEQLRQEVKNRSAFIIDKGLGDTFVRWKYE